MKRLSVFLLLLCLMGLTLMNIPTTKANPLYEDFTTYTEVDPNNNIDLVGTNHIDATVRRLENAYLYKDYGIDFFTDFEHLLDFRCQDINDNALYIEWMLTNDVGSLSELIAGSKTLLYIRTYRMVAGGTRSFSLNEVVTGTVYSDGCNGLSVATWYYLSIEKVGVSLTCKIYSTSELRDAGGDADVDTLALTLHSDWSFRYVYAVSSYNDGYAFQGDADIENLDLQLIPMRYVTFYYNDGGILRVDNVTISNGTQNEYLNGTVLELVSIPQNSTCVFSHFLWDSSNSTTNPYDLTIPSNLTVWCYFSVPEGGYGGIPFLFFGLVVGVLVGALVGFGSKK